MALSGPVSKTQGMSLAPNIQLLTWNVGFFQQEGKKRKPNSGKSEFIAQSQFVPKLCDLGATYQ